MKAHHSYDYLIIIISVYFGLTIATFYIHFMYLTVIHNITSSINDMKQITAAIANLQPKPAMYTVDY